MKRIPTLVSFGLAAVLFIGSITLVALPAQVLQDDYLSHSGILNVKAELNDVAIGHYVVLTLEADPTIGLGDTH